MLGACHKDDGPYKVQPKTIDQNKQLKAQIKIQVIWMHLNNKSQSNMELSSW